MVDVAVVEELVEELMQVEYDYGCHFEEDEAREIVMEAIAEYEDDPECYDDLDDAIDIIAHVRMYPKVLKIIDKTLKL